MNQNSSSILGSYDSAKRRREMQGKLEQELKEAEKRILESVKSPSEKESHVKSNGDGDLLKMEIDRATEEVKLFKEEVDQFLGPCFNKKYRGLLTKGEIFQCELDKLDLSHKEHMRQKRKELFDDIDNLVRELKNKVHADGKICEKCQVSVL